MAFNQDPVCEGVISRLIRYYKIDTCVETGTYLGNTTRWFASKVKNVHTIELNEMLYLMIHFDEYPNVTHHYGNSAETVKTLLPLLDADNRIMFYLDAHWNDYWPLLDEIRAIANSKFKGRCVIVIDDFKIPDRPDIPFDSYGDIPLDYEYVREALDLAIPGHVITYYIPDDDHLKSRGRLVACPAEFD